MLKQERHSLILTEIVTHNKVHSADLSLKLNVSEDTIRRDLKELAEEGHIKKVHGGAMSNPVSPVAVNNSHISYRFERLEIVKKALPFIEDGAFIILEGQHTSLMLVDLFPKDLSATIFTNSLPVASKLFDYHQIETFFLGGKLSDKSRSTTGMDVIDTLSEIHADICIMELSGIHVDIGMTDSDREYAITKKAMINASSNLVTLCLSKDLSSIQPFKVEGTNRVNRLITELNNEDAQLEAFRNKGVEVL